MPSTTYWHGHYGEGWWEKNLHRACDSLLSFEYKFGFHLFVWIWFCLFLSGLGRLVWTYSFLVNMNFHAKFWRVSLRCHPGVLSFLFLPWSEKTLQHADMWKNISPSPTKIPSFTTRGYWPVITQRAGDVLQWEEYKTFMAASWEKREKRQKNDEELPQESGQHPQCSADFTISRELTHLLDIWLDELSRMMQALAAEENVLFLLALSCCLILLIAIAFTIRDNLQAGKRTWFFFQAPTL